MLVTLSCVIVSTTASQLLVTLQHMSIYLSIYLWLYSPRGPWPLFQFLNLYTVGHLVGGISPSQGRYLHTIQHKHRINARRYPCLKWDSNPRSQYSSGRPGGHCNRHDTCTNIIHITKFVHLILKWFMNCFIETMSIVQWLRLALRDQSGPRHSSGG
jgi:hypothetical protein